MGELERAQMSQNPRSRRNLTKRPAKPAKGNGRVQRACKRLAEAVQGPITTRMVYEWAGGKWNAQRALQSIDAKQVGRAKTIGRPWLWVATPDVTPTSDDTTD
jgi:hypothetical protein